MACEKERNVITEKLPNESLALNPGGVSFPLPGTSPMQGVRSVASREIK
jgi:hypothetical protein